MQPRLQTRAAAGRLGLCALQRWMEVLARGAREQHAPALLLLRAAFRAPGAELGAAAAAAPPALFAPAAALLGGGLGGEVLGVLAAALDYSDAPAAPPGRAPPPQWPEAFEATGEDCTAGVAALARLAAAWQPGRRPVARGRLLPFLPAPGPAAA